MLFVAGCASSESNRTMRTGVSRNSRYTPMDPARPSQRGAQPPIVGSSAWSSEAAKWIGTPYRLGGASRAGMDCSGLIVTMYRNVARVELPRTAYEQSRTGTAIPQRELRPGDLLFFQTSKEPRINHAGIYLGQNRFVHASKSQGVVYSDLDETYYAEAYRGARRILR
jgi:cell wall-associated NlpC family hydrolase